MRMPRAPRARLALMRAERLLRDGQYSDALPIFTTLAREAEERGLYEPAANGFLQAARCLLELGRPREATDETLHAMSLLALAGRADRIRAVAERAAALLAGRGHPELAARLIQEANTQPEPPPGPPQITERQYVRAAALAARLPDRCPSCGAPVIPSELKWAGPGVGQCAYCGSVIKPTLPHTAH
ncbi:MAG: hypothetical protein H5T65_14125 [Chloroflexi bacterium]|nr:hypothetical protein [Chloroflexota bacterium]